MVRSIFQEAVIGAMSGAAGAWAMNLATHLRGLLGHLTLGAVTAVSSELLCWLSDD